MHSYFIEFVTQFIVLYIEPVKIFEIIHLTSNEITVTVHSVIFKSIHLES